MVGQGQDNVYPSTLFLAGALSILCSSLNVVANLQPSTHNPSPINGLCLSLHSLSLFLHLGPPLWFGLSFPFGHHMKENPEIRFQKAVAVRWNQPN